MNKKLKRHNSKLAMHNTNQLIIALLTLRAKNEIPTVRKISKMVGLSTFSFYFRYKNIPHSLAKWEEKTLLEFQHFLKKCRNPDDPSLPDSPSKFTSSIRPILSPIEITYLSRINDPNLQAITVWLYFMSRDRGIFSVVTKYYENQKILYRMAEVICSFLDIQWGLSRKPPSNSLPMRHFISSVVVMVIHWGINTACDHTKADTYIRMLMELIRNPSRYCQINIPKLR